MSPLLSILIPTHNRARYAISAIQSILAIPGDELELVVSDTSTDNELANFIADKQNKFSSDRRLNYFKPQEKLDMTGNHNSALAAATGEFVCLIGDDDTVVPDALIAALWARNNSIDIISPNVVASYVWPDFKSLLMGGKHASRLYFSRRMGGALIVESKDALANAMKNAAQGTDGLPKIYHGIVRRSVLEEIKKITGAYFHGSSPDVSGAIGLALCSKNFLIVDYPLTIPGASGGSNTGRSAMNKHKGQLGQEEQTKGYTSSGWSLGVPRFFSVETVWAHAALETIKRFDLSQVKSFNYIRLLAICKVLHPEFLPLIDKAIDEVVEVTGGDLKSLRRLIRNETYYFRLSNIFRLMKRLSKPTAAGGRLYVSNLNTVADAPAALAKHLKQMGMSWNEVVKSIS